MLSEWKESPSNPHQSTPTVLLHTIGHFSDEPSKTVTCTSLSDNNYSEDIVEITDALEHVIDYWDAEHRRQVHGTERKNTVYSHIKYD